MTNSPWIIAMVGGVCVIGVVIATIGLAMVLDVSSETASGLQKMAVPIILVALWLFRSWTKNRAK